MTRVRGLLLSVAIFALPVIAGCSSSSTSTPPTPPPNPRLYVANDGGSGLVQIFAPPFSGTSVPAVSFQDGTSTDVDDVAFDALGRLYVGNFGQQKIDVYAPPFTNTSTASFSITTSGSPEGIDVDAAGNLYVADGKIDIFNAPLSSASTASITIPATVTGLKLDKAGKLYAGGGGNVNIFNPPFTNASTPAVSIPVASVWGIAIDQSGNLWAVSRTGSMNVLEFVPPFTNASTPAITITTNLADALYPALDSSGNLYISTFGTMEIAAVLAPLSNASTVAFHFAAPSSNGIRFGP